MSDEVRDLGVQAPDVGASQDVSEEELMRRILDEMKNAESEEDVLSLLDKAEEQGKEVVSDDEQMQEVQRQEGQEVQEELQQVAEHGFEQGAEQQVGREIEASDEVEEVEEAEGPRTLVEEIMQKIESDPVLKQLAKLPEEARIAWAKEAGTEGLIKLMELQKLETALMIERAKVEAQLPTLDALIDEFAMRNKDLLQDERIAEIAKGLEMTYLAEMGYRGYWEVPPPQFKRILDRIEKRIREIAQVMGIKGQGVGASGVKGGAKGEIEGGLSGLRSSPSVGDVGAGRSGDVGAVDVLMKIADDPFKLEEALDKLPKSKLDEILAELE